MPIVAHECVRLPDKTGKNEVFVCRACVFVGSLLDAIKHAVANQFRV